MSLTRREFLGATSTLLFASTLHGADSPRRAAVIGHTGRGDFGHGLETIFRGRDGIEVVALADPDPSGRAKATAAAGAVRSYADWREMLAKERPHLVSLAMRHADQHAAIAVACLEAGAHLYIEKPFVRSPDEADAVLEAAQKHRRRVAVAHTMRMAPTVQRLRRAIGDGVIGELREMRAFGKQDSRAGGEDMMVLGSHLFDLMRLIAGDARSCTARVLQDGRDITVTDRRQVKDNVGWLAGDQVFGQFAFDRGVNATFTSDARLRATTGHWGIEFHGSKGSARLNCDIAPNVFLRSASPWTASGRLEEWKPIEPALAKADHDLIQIPVNDWLEAIARDREPECSARNGAAAVEMVMAIYHSALRQTRVGLPLSTRAHPLGAG